MTNVFPESDLLPVSALQHLAFCERQCALIYLEGIWTENVLTVEGRHLHQRVHNDESEVREGVRIVRGLRIHSLRLGLVGVADVVEFHPLGPADPPHLGAELPGVRGRWRPYLIEYKRGRPKHGHFDEIQLCGQALCLEEMLGLEIKESALFYGRPRRRHVVVFDAALRDETEAAARRLHELLAERMTPAASYSKKCDRCSLVEICLPKSTQRRSVARYLASAVIPGKNEQR